MKKLAAALIAATLIAGPAFAQQNPPPANADQAAPAASTPALTKSGKPRAKDVRKQCREEAESQGLKGADRRKSIEDCFVKARPDLAVAETCRHDPSLKGMDKDARKAAIKDCIKKNKQQ